MATIFSNDRHDDDAIGFFEGSEKLLEIWFKPISKCSDNVINGSSDILDCRISDSAINGTPLDSRTSDSAINGSAVSEAERKRKLGLRAVSRSQWDELLTHVRCTIVSTTCNEHIDAYVLSESSMFITEHRLLLKTCGTTTLLPAVPLVLELAKKECGLTEVQDLFYSRKNFMEPTKQMYPHQTFDDEVSFLDKYFDGSAYVLGAINGDHWYLYTLNKEEMLFDEPDQTLEILMSDLDPEAMKPFYKNDDYVSELQTTEATGIAALMPGAILDPLMFTPCGYSINAIRNRDYFTIHVTPQSNCSFASFETNLRPQTDNEESSDEGLPIIREHRLNVNPRNDLKASSGYLPYANKLKQSPRVASYGKLIHQVLDIFKPRKFIITLFRNQLSDCIYQDEELTGYKRQDSISYRFHQYNLSFGHFKLST